MSEEEIKRGLDFLRKISLSENSVTEEDRIKFLQSKYQPEVVDEIIRRYNEDPYSPNTKPSSTPVPTSLAPIHKETKLHSPIAD